GDDGERRHRGELAGGGGQVDLLQGRRPGIEAGAAVRLVDLGDQVGQALVVAGEVVVVLHREGDVELSGAPGALLQRGDRVRPEAVVAYAGALEGGEDAHQGATQVPREARQLDDREH